MKKIFILSLLTIMAMIIHAQVKDVLSYEVRNTRLVLLSEGQGQGNTSILLGATPAMLEEYVPHGTFPNAVNTFLFQADGKNILIDTGFGKELFNHLEDEGVKPEDIDIVLLTHMHGDHIGGLLRDGKVAFANAEVYIPLPEYNYWTDKDIMRQMPEKSQSGFLNAQKVVKAYKGKVRLFTPGDFSRPARVIKNVSAIAAYGHTPGHTMYLLDMDGSNVLVWGDLTHATPIQMPFPQISVTYDVNPEQAAASRQEVLKYVMENNLTIAGMHIASPSIGKVKLIRPGSYEFVSLDFFD